MPSSIWPLQPLPLGTSALTSLWRSCSHPNMQSLFLLFKTLPAPLLPHRTPSLVSCEPLLKRHLHKGRFPPVCVCVCVYAHDQSSPTLCNPMDCSLPGFFVLGTVQARLLEWVAISSSRGSSWHHFLSHCFIALYRLSSQAVIYFHPFIHLWIQCLLV